MERGTAHDAYVESGQVKIKDSNYQFCFQTIAQFFINLQTRIEVYKKRATTHFYEYGSPLRYLNIFLIGVRAFRVGGKPHFILRSFILILLSI